MRIAYGLDVADQNDKYISIVERGVDIFTRIIVPGRYLVEALPWLRHVPMWFPGAGFKRDAAKWQRDIHALRTVPFNAAVEQMVR